jgi:hypothetical protein
VGIGVVGTAVGILVGLDDEGTVVGSADGRVDGELLGTPEGDADGFALDGTVLDGRALDGIIVGDAVVGTELLGNELGLFVSPARVGTTEGLFVGR